MAECGRWLPIAAHAEVGPLREGLEGAGGGTQALRLPLAAPLPHACRLEGFKGSSVNLWALPTLAAKVDCDADIAILCVAK